MSKMVISLVIEGKDEDLHEIKGNIISTASEALVSCRTDVIKELKYEPIKHSEVREMKQIIGEFFK